MAKRKLKKFHLHPITSIFLLMILVIILSMILSSTGVSATYNTINLDTGELQTQIITVENQFTYQGVKNLISNATKNFISFAPLGTLLITLFGLGVADATGLIDTILRRRILRISPSTVTFLLFLIAIFSSIVNEVGYAVMIPIGALVFLINGRNPLTGIAAAFAGVAFGYSISFFVGSTDIALLPYTTVAASLIDEGFHVSMTSNLFIMIVSCFVLAGVGTFVTEKFIAKKMGRYAQKTRDDLGQTKEIEYLDLQYEEQKKLKEESLEKKGLHSAAIVGIAIAVVFIYMIIPGLPLSGMLLDLEESAYVNQLFGSNSYFQAGFTYMVAIFFAVTGIAYGISAKSIKNDKDLMNKLKDKLVNIGMLVVMIFFASQLIALFKETNIGYLLTASITNLIKNISFTGIPLILVVMILIAIANIFVPSSIAKWSIISPVLVPIMMQSNISPQFTQYIFRASESMTNGITILLAYFIVYLGYLNVYNKDQDKPITLRQGIAYMLPYMFWLGIAWVFIIIMWYIIGLPLGPGVFPTL
ncbi:MAG TPA: AbgT family transporter [Bacilli bacterium]|nr:AbgT family transporter [Bacilli bacterium]